MAKKIPKITDRNEIVEILEDISIYIKEYICSSDSNFVLYYKYLNHSDLATFGKALDKNKLDDNLLYYLTLSEMRKNKINPKKRTKTAHQSNINLPDDFWGDLNMKIPKDISRDGTTNKINTYAEVYLVNDTLKYFSSEYTNKVFEVLGKKPKKEEKWNSSSNVIVDEGDITQIEISVGVHGLGLSKNKNFHNLRHHLFKDDAIYFLIEKDNCDKLKLFVMPYKNPIFFSLINERNSILDKYMDSEKEIIDSLPPSEETAKKKAETYRKHQNKWRKKLAEEMKNYSPNGEVFCPFTGVKVNFEEVGTIFRASHIKPYVDSSEKERYDINNGLILIADADALFDQHYISINKNKNLVFSFLLQKNKPLRDSILLKPYIFKDILNDERIKYLKIHYETFLEEEEKRKEKF